MDTQLWSSRENADKVGMRQRVTKQKILSSVLLFLILSGCEQNTLSLSLRGQPLSISSDIRGISTANPYLIPVIGGTTPYTFSLISGPGSVDIATGVYTPTTTGTVEFRITDAKGRILEKSLQVVDPLVLTPAPSPWAAFTDLSVVISGGSGSGYETSVADQFLNFWNQLTRTFTRPWGSGNFEITVKDQLGFTQSFSYPLLAGSVPFPAAGSDWSNINDMDYDSDGNIYICGDFQGQFGAATSAAPGIQNFVIKINSKGQIVWSYQTTGDIQASCMNLKFYNGGVYVVGTNYSATGTFEGIAITPNHGGYAFKMDSTTGTKQWLEIFEGTRMGGLDVSSSGEIYVSGTSSVAVHGQVPTGHDAYLSKLNDSGVVQWVRFVGSPTSYHPVVKIMPDGNITCAGGTDANTVPGAINPSGKRQPLIFRFDPNGALLSRTQVPVGNTNQWNYLPTNGNMAQNSYIGSNILLCGLDWDNFTNYNTTDIFVGLVSSSGNIEFLHNFPVGVDKYSDPSCSITSEGIYFSFRTSANFEGLGNTSQDLIVLKFDIQGSRIWTRKIPLISPERLISSGWDSIMAVTNSPKPEFYVSESLAGDFDGTGIPRKATEVIRVNADGTFERKISNDDPATGYFYPWLSYNKLTGDYFSFPSVYDATIDGTSFGSNGGSLVQKFNADYVRQ